MRRLGWWVTFMVLASGPAHAESDLVISSGREGGSYHQMGRRIVDKMLVDHGRSAELRISAGSLENLRQLDDPDSPVNLVFAQADAVDRYLETHPAFSDELAVLGDVGRECVLLVARHGGSLKSVSDLKEAGDRRISLDDAESGAAVTYGSMTALEPGFGQTEPVFVDTLEALLQLKVGGPLTKIDAVMIVQRPRRFSKPVQVVLENPEVYQLLAITAADLPNASLPDGSQVYSFERVVVGAERRALKRELDTLCMRGLLLGSQAKLDKQLRGQISELMLQSPKDVVGWDE